MRRSERAAAPRSGVVSPSPPELSTPPTPLPPKLARTLYNIADAWGVDAPGPVRRLGPDVERALLARGVGAARTAWLALRWIELRPALSWPPGRSFSRRSRSDRQAWLTRIESAPGGRAVAWIRDLVADAGEAQSSVGA